MVDLDWVSLAIEAPLTALLVLFIYKCYRARVSLKSRCCKGLSFGLTMPGEVSRAPSDESTDSNHVQNRDNSVSGKSANLWEVKRSEHAVEHQGAGHSSAEGDLPPAKYRSEESALNKDRL